MKRTIIAAAVASLVTIGVALTAIAQSNALAGLLNPLIVKISQDVPVELTVATAQDDGSVITSTVPLTVGVDIAITIQGSQVVSLTAGTGEAAVAVQALPLGEELVDDSGIPYTLESMDGFVLSQSGGRTGTSDGFFWLLGELRNDGNHEGNVKITVTLYDASGKLLNVGSGFTEIFPLSPGRSSAFELRPGNTDFTDVARYRIQITPY